MREKNHPTGGVVKYEEDVQRPSRRSKIVAVTGDLQVLYDFALTAACGANPASS